MQEIHQFTIFADYFQFIVQDESSKDDFSSIWTQESHSLAIATGETAICPVTLRNVDVQVEIHVCDIEPTISLDDFDHAVETSVDIPSGTVVVMGCTDYFPEAPRFHIANGSYRVFFGMQGTNSIVTEWEPANDKYIVYLWPGNSRPAKLLKHWKDNN